MKPAAPSAGELQALFDALARALAAGAAPSVQAHADALRRAMQDIVPRLSGEQARSAATQLRNIRSQMARRAAAVERQLATLVPERGQPVTYGSLRPGARSGWH